MRLTNLTIDDGGVQRTRGVMGGAEPKIPPRNRSPKCLAVCARLSASAIAAWQFGMPSADRPIRDCNNRAGAEQ